MIDQCGSGHNTLHAQIRSIRLKTYAQDSDGEDDLVIELKSGLCSGSANKFHLSGHQTQVVDLGEDSDGDPLDLGSVNVMYDFPLTISLIEEDILFNDRGMNDIVIEGDAIKIIQDKLETGMYRYIEVVGFIVAVEENAATVVYNLLEEWGIEGLFCISALDIAATGLSGNAKQAWEVYGHVITAEDLINGQADSVITPEALQDFEDEFGICPLEILANEFSVGEAMYEVTVRLTLAAPPSDISSAASVTSKFVLSILLACLLLSLTKDEQT